MQSTSVVILLYEFQDSVLQVLEVAVHTRVDLFPLDCLEETLTVAKLQLVMWLNRDKLLLDNYGIGQRGAKITVE